MDVFDVKRAPVAAYVDYRMARANGADRNAAIEAVHRVCARYSTWDSARRAIDKGRVIVAEWQAQDALSLKPDEAKALAIVAQFERLARERAMYDEPAIEQDDYNEFTEWLERRASRPGALRFVFTSDWHLPDINEQAWRLFLQMMTAVRPELIVLGGDIFDLDALSSWGANHGRSPRPVLDEVQGDYAQRITDLRNVIPSRCRLVAFGGNHDGLDEVGRPGRMRDEQRAFYDLFAPEFVNTVRADGRVWWVDQKHEIKLHSVILEHGTRTGENAGKNGAKDRGWGIGGVQGHNHTPSLYVLRQDVPGDRGAHRIIMRASNGAFQNNVAHYHRNTDKTKHIHGFTVGRASLNSWVHDIAPVIMHRDEHGALVAFWGDRQFREDAGTYLKEYQPAEGAA